MRSVTIVSGVVAGLATILAAAPPVQSAGTATGTLAVGGAPIRLTHAYAFAEPGASGSVGYRILVTDKPLTPAAITHAAAAGSNDDARQELAVELAGEEIRGIEAVVAGDRTVTRLNVYSAASAMGMMLLTKGDFEAKTFGPAQVAGRFRTPAPIEDARIRKSIEYDVTFAAPVHGAK